MTLKQAIFYAERQSQLWAIGSMAFILTTPALLVLVWKLL